MEGVRLNPDIVTRHCDVMASREAELKQNIPEMKSQLQDVASVFYDVNEPDKVQVFRDILKDVLMLQHEVETRQQALQHLQRRYEPSLDKTNFKELLGAKTEEIQNNARFDPEATDDMRKFDKETGNEWPIDDDDELELMDSTGFVNDKCPITGKSVLDLQEPVEDSKGYIYEKAAIMSLIRQARTNSISCPMAGTSHVVKASDLQPSNQVKRARRKALLTQTTQDQQATQAHADVVDVVDADDL